MNIAIENRSLQLIYPLKMGIFRTYDSLPEGNILTSDLRKELQGIRRDVAEIQERMI